MEKQPRGRLSGRVAIITGGAGGMGAETARLFVAEGARVVVTDLNAQAGAALAAELGKDALFQEHDVTDPDQWQAVASLAMERFGAIDVLVNNAGILRYATIVDMSPEDFSAVMAVNVNSVFLGTRAMAPHMMRGRRGAIVNISSTGAMSATNATSAYAASKAAVQAFTKAAALELGPHGIRVNSVHPGGINTPMTNPDADPDAIVNQNYRDVPLQRAGRASEVAHLSLFLASDESSYCTGTDFVADGGFLAGRYYAFLPGAPGDTETNGP